MVKYTLLRGIMKYIKVLILTAVILIALPMLLNARLAAEEAIRGVELVVLMEDTVSLAQSDSSAERFELLSILIDLMDPTDLVGAIKFDNDTELLREISWKGTGDGYSGLIRSIRESSGEARSANMEKALLTAFDLFETEGNAPDVPKRVVILISSGRVNIGNADENEKSRGRIFSEVLPQYQKNSIPIYAVGIGKKQDRELLEALGAFSGGFHFSIDNPHNLSSAAIDIFNDIKHLDIAPLEGLSFRIGEDAEEALIVANGNRITKDEKCGIVSPGRVFFRKGKNTDEVNWSEHKNYNIIRLQYPQEGRWLLQGRADQNCVVFLESPRRIKFMTPRKLMFHDENIVVAAYLDQGGRMIQNPQVLERTVFKAALENDDHSETGSIELQNTEPGIYAGMLPLEGFTGTVRLNLYALSTDATNKSYALINVSEESWLQVVSPSSEIPAGNLPDIEVHVLSDIDEKGRYEMAVQLDRGGVGSWSAQLECVNDSRIFRGRIEADLDPGDYTFSFMLRRFASPVAEEMQMKSHPLHVAGMIEQKDAGSWGWLIITGGIGLVLVIGVSGFFWYRRRKHLAALIKEEIPMTILPQSDKKEQPQAAVLEEMEDEKAQSNASIFGDLNSAPKRVDPLEHLTQNLKVDGAQKKDSKPPIELQDTADDMDQMFSVKEPKLAIESQGLTDVIDQVVQNVEGRVEKGPKVKKKVTGAYQEEEEVLMVKSGGNVNLKVPAGSGIDKLAESLNSVEDLAGRQKDEAAAVTVVKGPVTAEPVDETKIFSDAVEVPLSDEPVMLSGKYSDDTVGTASGGFGGSEADVKAIITETDPPDMRIKVNSVHELPGEKPMQKKARIPPPPQVSQNELDALLQQARQNIEKK